jgi:hypothetical protein
MDATETPVSSAAPTPEYEEICDACGIAVVSFVGKPHMWKLLLAEDNDTKPLPFVNDTICVGCVTDLIKFRAEVLAKKNK